MTYEALIIPHVEHLVGYILEHWIYYYEVLGRYYMEY